MKLTNKPKQYHAELPPHHQNEVLGIKDECEKHCSKLKLWVLGFDWTNLALAQK